MRWSIIRLIWIRELKDQLRDRRTLFMIAVLPLLLYPILGIAVLKFAKGFSEKSSIIGVVRGNISATDFPELPIQAPSSQIQSTLSWYSLTPCLISVFPAGLEGSFALSQARRWLPEYMPFLRQGHLTVTSGRETQDLSSHILGQGSDWLSFEFLDEKIAEQALARKEIDLLLSAPVDFFHRLEREETKRNSDSRALIKIMGYPDRDRFRLAMHRLEPLLDSWKKQLKNIRLSRHGLPIHFDNPFVLVEPFSKKSTGGADSLLDMMIRIFPFMLVMWCLAGALYPAVDLCAGEKERGTMETLLISPAGREEIVLGKFLTIWVFSGGTAFLNLLSMGWTTMFASQLPQGSLPLVAFLWCLVLLLPLSAFFSAISLAVGAYARSSKEGQYYLMPLFLITMPMMFLTLAPGVELSPFYSLVPVTGAALLMQKLITAGSLAEVPWLYFIPVLAPIVLYSVLALRWAIAQFQREEVLFREAERLDLMLWIRRLFREKEETPTTGQAFFAFGLLLGLRWLASGIGQHLPIVVHTAVSQLAFVAAPVLMMALLINTRPRLGLSLKWPRFREIGLAAILAVLLLPPFAALTQVVFSQFPHLTRLLEDRQPLIHEMRTLYEGQPLDPDQVLPFLLAFAFLPAICEEAAFRGFILSGLLKYFRPRTAVVLSSFLFALFHMNVFQFLPAFFLGMVLGLLTIRSRSLVPAMIFHLLHLSVLIGGIHLASMLKGVLPPFVLNLWNPLIAVCLATALGILWWLYRKPYVDLERELALRRQGKFPQMKIDN